MKSSINQVSASVKIQACPVSAMRSSSESFLKKLLILQNLLSGFKPVVFSPGQSGSYSLLVRLVRTDLSTVIVIGFGPKQPHWGSGLSPVTNWSWSSGGTVIPPRSDPTKRRNLQIWVNPILHWVVLCILGLAKSTVIAIRRTSHGTLSSWPQIRASSGPAACVYCLAPSSDSSDQLEERSLSPDSPTGKHNTCKTPFCRAT